MSFGLLLASYGILFFGVRLLMHFTSKRVLYFLTSVILFQSVILIEKSQRNQKSEWIVFHKPKQTIVGFRDENKVTFVHTVDSIQSLNSIVNSYKIGENVKASFVKQQLNLYFYKNQPILLIDSLGIYQLQNLNKPIVLLQNSPKINLERMIKTLQPIQIIADGSNYKTYMARWEKTALQLQIPFHYTGEKGAFIKK
jgi:competence protein ComEC